MKIKIDLLLDSKKVKENELSVVDIIEEVEKALDTVKCHKYINDFKVEGYDSGKS